MSKLVTADILRQLDSLIDKFEDFKKRSKHSDCSDISRDEASEFVTATTAAIRRVVGADNEFSRQAENVLQAYKPWNISSTLTNIGGTLKAFRAAVADGYLVTFQELIHANLFNDFLEMAEYLLKEGYKDAAAVMIGSVLEEHLRKLCDHNGIPTEFLDSKGDPRPKRADALNSDLANNSIYSKLDQKNVMAWLDLRNKAAHGLYGGYTLLQVELLSQSVRDFIGRYPA